MSAAVNPVERTLTQAQLDAYADASGDHNPIHIDPSFAATTPFGGTIAHGMLVLALIGEVMYATHGAAWSTRGKLKVRFKAPARPGDTVTASAEPTKQAEGSLDYAIQCVNQRGEVLIEGRAAVASMP
ncbi:MAG: MaoC family dehydratase [Chloroflexota bacterium]|nr:MaoC family dehydratase [Chloroflexota bacterium]